MLFLQTPQNQGEGKGVFVVTLKLWQGEGKGLLTVQGP